MPIIRNISISYAESKFAGRTFPQAALELMKFPKAGPGAEAKLCMASPLREVVRAG